MLHNPDILKPILYDEGLESQRSIVRYLDTLAKTCPDVDVSQLCIMIADEAPLPHHDVTGIYESLTERYGIDFRVLLSAWEQGHKPGIPEDYMQQCVRTMDQLEKHQKGSVALLHERFNLCNFARYPLEVLTHMVDKVDDDILCGAMVYPEWDDNNAFFGIKDRVAGLFTQLKGLKCGLRIYEASTLEQVVKPLTDACDVYKRPLAFLIAALHGTPTSMELAKRTTPSRQVTTALLRQAILGETCMDADRLKKGLDMMAQIYLYSCKSGEQDLGVAHLLAELLRKTVLAQTTKDVMSKMSAYKVGDAIRIAINYGDEVDVVRRFDPSMW